MWEENLTVPLSSAQLAGVGIANRRSFLVITIHCLHEASWLTLPMWEELEGGGKGWGNLSLDKDTFRFLLRFT